ncbi:MAG: hypothetical protein RR893_02510 [Clostridia bacterium]
MKRQRAVRPGAPLGDYARPGHLGDYARPGAPLGGYARPGAPGF